MASRDSALTGTELTNAAGATTVETYYHAVDATTIATATIASDPAFPMTSIAVSGTSGWTGVRAGHTAVITDSFTGAVIDIVRVKGSDSTHLLVAETSAGDPGLLPILVRSRPPITGDTVTVIDRDDIWSVAPYIAGSGLICEDFDQVVGTNNTTPAPMVDIVITDTGTGEVNPNHFFAIIADGASYATLTLVAAGHPWPTSSSVTYLWTFPGAFTITSGSTTTASVTVQVPPSATSYQVRLSCAENVNGNAQERNIVIVCHTESTLKPVSGMTNDRWNRQGWTASITTLDDELASIPDGSMIIMRQRARFNGAVIPSACSHFIGWVSRQNRQSDPGLRSADLDLIGPTAIMGIRHGTSQIWGTAYTDWQYLPASLLTIAFATWWIVKWRMRLLHLFNFTPWSTSATGQNDPALKVDPGNPLQQIQSLVKARLLNFGADPDGSLWLMPQPSLVDHGSRGSIPVRETLDQSIMNSVQWPKDQESAVGWLQFFAFTWDGSAAIATPLQAIAPGSAPGQGPVDNKIDGLLVASQGELQQIGGDEYARQNNPYKSITIKVQSNRGALYKPAQMYYLPTSLPDWTAPDNIAYADNAVLLEVSRSYNPDGTVDTQITVEAETYGYPAEFQAVPPPQSAYASSPAYSIGIPISPLVLSPTPQSLAKLPIAKRPPVTLGKVPTDGSAAIAWSATKLYYVIGIGSTPSHTDITPTSSPPTAIFECEIDPRPATRGQVWMLDNNGSNSIVRYLPSQGGSWSIGASQTGLWTILRELSSGTLAIYAPNIGGGTPFTLNFFNGAGIDGLQVPDPLYNEGVYNAGLDRMDTSTYSGGGSHIAALCSFLVSPGVTITRVKVNFTLTATDGAARSGIYFDDTPTSTAYYTSFPIGTSTADTGVISLTPSKIDFNITNITTPGGYINWIIIQGTVGAVEAKFSSNNGSTFGSPLTISSTGIESGYGAFDSNLNTLLTVGGGGDNHSYYDSNGGAYASAYTFSKAIGCIVVPWYTLTGSLNTGTLPDHLVSLTASDSGSSLYWIWNAGASRTDFTPTLGGYPGLATGPNCIATWINTKIAAILSFNGTNHLMIGAVSGSSSVSWVDRGIVGVNAACIRFRRVGGTGQYLYWVDGSNLVFSPDLGITKQTIALSGTLLGARTWG